MLLLLPLLVPHYFSEIDSSDCSISRQYTGLPQMDVDISSPNRPFIKRKYLKILNTFNTYMALPLVGPFHFAKYSLTQLGKVGLTS